MARIEKRVILGQANELDYTQVTINETANINRKWRQLCVRRSDCLTEKIDKSRQNDLLEVNRAIEEILGKLKVIEDEKTTFLQKMEDRSAALLSRLDEMMNFMPDCAIINKERATDIIRKLSAAFEIPQHESTLDISESDLVIYSN